jgi:hypothetical protein
VTETAPSRQDSEDRGERRTGSGVSETMRREVKRTLAMAVMVVGWSMTPAVVDAQGRLEPAETVRVLELVEGTTGGVVRTIVEDLAPAEILRIQTALARAGYDPRSRSGELDPATRRALISFQTARGLEICGCVTYETVVALGIPPEVVARIEGGVAPAVGYGVSSSTVIVDRTLPFVIVVPGHVGRHRHGFFLGPGVVVGHEPAVGAGQLFRRRISSRDHRFRDDHRVRDARPLPPPSRPGSRIRTGDPVRPPSGGTLRPARPRP